MTGRADRSTRVSAAYCTQILAITRRRGQGRARRPARGIDWGPPSMRDAAVFRRHHRNKRSIGLRSCFGGGLSPAQNAGDRPTPYENFKPGTLDKWGIARSLCAKNFRAVHFRISGFGSSTAPRGGIRARRHHPGHDREIAATVCPTRADADRSCPAGRHQPQVSMAAIGILMVWPERQKPAAPFLETTLLKPASPSFTSAFANYFMHAGRRSLTQRSSNRYPTRSSRPKPPTFLLASAMTAPFRQIGKEIGSRKLGA